MLVEANKIEKKCLISNKFIISILEQAGLFLKKTKKLPKELSVAIVNDKIIKKLNLFYRQKNEPTDVLSFKDPAQIIVSWPQIKKQAREQKHSQKKEMIFLLTHGFLHILGYVHKTKIQEDLMEKQTQQVLAFLKKKNLLK